MKSATAFTGGKIVTPCGIIENGFCRVENGVITAVGEGHFEGGYDLEGRYLLPGFIDIHCHGGAGYDFMDATPAEAEEISRYHLLHGTTSLLATTMTDSYPAIIAALENCKKVMAGGRTTIFGVHLEGPWLSPAQCGAQAEKDMKEPDLLKLSEWLKDFPFIRRVSAAPELKGGLELGRFCRERGIVASVAHTDADFSLVEEAAENGYTLVTHLYSGMKGVTRKNAFRTAGAVEAGLYSDKLYAEIIGDGVHLPPELLRFIYKVKGADKLCLITDAMRASGLEEGSRSVLGRLEGGLSVIVEDGVAKTEDRLSFAGSVATMGRVFKTVALATGAGIEKVSQMASGTPARAMGLKDRGEIAPGKRADLIVMNEDFNIEKIFFGGEEV